MLSIRRPGPYLKDRGVWTFGAVPSGLMMQIGEKSIHVPARFARHGGDDVAVGVEGQRDGAVAEQLLDDLGVDPTGQEVSRCGVTQIVDPKSGQPSFVSSAVKLSPDPSKARHGSREPSPASRPAPVTGGSNQP